MHSRRPAASLLTPTAPPPEPALRALLHARYPGGVDVSSEDGRAAAAETERLLDEGSETIFGATVLQEGMLASFDVLLQRGGRRVGLLFRPSTKPKEKHFLDCALAVHLWRQAGVDLDDVGLLLLNAQYVRHGALDPRELFVEERIMRRLRFTQQELRGRMQMLKRMYEKDRKRAAAVAAGEPVAPPPQYGKQEVTLPAGPVEIETDAPWLRAFLGGISYPLYFMDFEAYQTAIPEYDQHWPFRQIPFQFSLHRQEAPGAPLVHEGFIASGQSEPVAAFGRALLDAIGPEGSILVYSRDSEQLMLDQLRTDHPEWAEAIDALSSRLVDLQLPFMTQHVRIPVNGNKVSLKYVLPALVPEMSYAALTIAGGEEANAAYNRLRSATDPEVVRQICEDLDAYCALDTLAMAHILERLRELAQ
ncbi:DUF2779 domain-containing protein [Flaviaesturariibacter terrae]